MIKLRDDQAIYIDTLWRDMRHAVRRFREFDAKWNKLNDELNERFDRQGTDMVQRDKDKRINITLTGYLNGAQWWRDKAASLAAVIQAEKAAMEMMKGGPGWEPMSSSVSQRPPSSS